MCLLYCPSFFLKKNRFLFVGPPRRVMFLCGFSFFLVFSPQKNLQNKLFLLVFELSFLTMSFVCFMFLDHLRNMFPLQCFSLPLYFRLSFILFPSVLSFLSPLVFSFLSLSSSSYFKLSLFLSSCCLDVSLCKTAAKLSFAVFSCQCSTCTETPTQQSATTQDQHHAQGLALCHDVTLDIVTHRWVPAGHPQYTGAREGRLWVAQAQTQLTLFVDPQSLSLECEHGSGARRFEVQLGPRTQPELVHQRTQDSAVKPRRVADARVTLNPTRRRRPC